MSAHDRTSTSRRWRWRQPTGCASGGESTIGTVEGVGRRLGLPIGQGHPTGAAVAASTARSMFDAVLAVDLLELDLDDLLARRRDVLADVVGPDRQLAMAAIDEDREADRLRPPEVDEGVHRGPDRAAGVQDVVDEDDRRAVQVEREVGALDDGLLGDERQVVAVEGDVERADRDRRRPRARRSRRRSGGRAGRRGAGCRRARDRPCRPASRRSRGEIRIVARRISSAVMICRPLIAPSRASRGSQRPHGAGVKGRRDSIPRGRRGRRPGQ